MNAAGLEPKREPDKLKLLDQVREVIRLVLGWVTGKLIESRPF